MAIDGDDEAIGEEVATAMGGTFTVEDRTGSSTAREIQVGLAI